VTRFPVRRACRLEAQPEEHRWLVEGLWAAEAVGVLGGEPKCCKSFCALDVAVSVASGAACLGQFRAAQTGRVLLYAAEDPQHVVRERLAGICGARCVDFEALDVMVITAPTVRIDLDGDREYLASTVEAVKPKLLVLDPFVRLHRCNENDVQEVAPMLSYLRNLQRRFHCAVLLVHHARKGGHARGGQALRGSSELHAIGDSNLYLRRSGERLLLSIEHRAAPSVDDIPVGLRDDDGGLCLRTLDDDEEITETPPSGDGHADLDNRILAALSTAEPLTPRQLRSACRVRMARIYDALQRLGAARRILRNGAGYRLA
jgi:hypothetical protein